VASGRGRSIGTDPAARGLAALEDLLTGVLQAKVADMQDVVASLSESRCPDIRRNVSILRQDAMSGYPGARPSAGSGSGGGAQNCQPSRAGPLPPAPVHDLVEGAAVGIADRPQRTIRRIAEVDEIRRVAVIREAEQTVSQILVGDGRVA
jgi:hypothetical protein